ncbi:unnamed protein product, partial [Iphiclides podalirius]
MIRFPILLLEALVFSWSYATAAEVNLDAIVANVSSSSIFGVLLEKFLDAGLSALREARNDSSLPKPGLRTCDRAAVDAVVGARVDELRALLHDDANENDNENDQLTLKGGDETTIVELAANETSNPLRDNVRKYKRLRRKIHKALVEESVSGRTVDLTVRTLDEMIAGMISSRCSWKRAEARERSRKAVDGVARIPDAWRSEWNSMRERYSELFEPPPGNRSGGVRSLMEKLPSFFENILREGETLARRYSIKCERMGSVLEADRLNGANVSRRTDVCGGRVVSVCTTELKRYLVSVYKSISLGAAKVLNDFVSMYRIDVNANRKSINRGVLADLELVAQQAENHVCSLFTQRVREFSLDRSQVPDAYIEALHKLTEAIIERVKTNTRQNIRRVLKDWDAKLRERVVADIKANMNMELGRIAEELDERSCRLFQTCNSRYVVKARRLAASGQKGVFVKVQMTFDDESDYNLMEHSGRADFDRRGAFEGNSSQVPFKVVHSANEFKHVKPASVTRTTKL